VFVFGRLGLLGLLGLCIPLCSAEKFWCGDCWAWQEMTTVRLAGHQVELLFSTLWLEANMADNWPPSYEAIAHTYSLALIFSRPTVRYQN